MNPTKTRIKDILWHGGKALLCAAQLWVFHLVTMKSVGNLMSFLYTELVVRKGEPADVLLSLIHPVTLIPAVLGHHERWDGKGYPRGIAGEEIPVSARCLAIADVFDAMTTDRPYRKGLPLEYALEEILRQAGTQLDPELAPEFVNLIRNRSIPLSAQAAKNQN